MEPKTLIIYDYFFPAFRAGGITQSLYNLFSALEAKNKNVLAICQSRDFNGEILDENEKLANVAYLNKLELPKYLVKLDKRAINHIYLNGIFSPFFFLIPLVYFRCFFPRIKVIIAPRGMLQKGALEIRSTKKKGYIGILKVFGLLKNVNWHATDIQEQEDIKAIFGQKSKVIIAQNIAKRPVEKIKFCDKDSNGIRLIYLSLITEKKNLLLLIETLAPIKINLTLDIFGPIKDQAYWISCKKAIEALPSNIIVTYKGEVEPSFVQNTITNYHALILPSKGENFGHAIYESLSVGRPVIISEYTPWIKLNEKKVGWNTKLTEKSIAEAIIELHSLGSETYGLYCENAYNLACAYYQESTQMEAYEKLFE